MISRAAALKREADRLGFAFGHSKYSGGCGCFDTDFLRGLGGKLCKLPAMPSNPVPVDDLRPTPAVGVVCIRGDEVLLIRRGTPPKQGEWSIPGGRIEPGEPAKVAALRELMEETSVKAELIGLLDVIDAVFHNRAGELLTRHYVLIDYAARWISGEPVAGDDAAEARFFHQSELGSLELWSETRRIIEKGFELLRV